MSDDDSSALDDPADANKQELGYVSIVNIWVHGNWLWFMSAQVGTSQKPPGTCPQPAPCGRPILQHPLVFLNSVTILEHLPNEDLDKQAKNRVISDLATHKHWYLSFTPHLSIFSCDSSRDVNAYLSDWRIFHSILDSIPGLRQYYDNTSDMDIIFKLVKKVRPRSITFQWQILELCRWMSEQTMLMQLMPTCSKNTSKNIHSNGNQAIMMTEKINPTEDLITHSIQGSSYLHSTPSFSRMIHIGMTANAYYS